MRYVLRTVVLGQRCEPEPSFERQPRLRPLVNGAPINAHRATGLVLFSCTGLPML